MINIKVEGLDEIKKSMSKNKKELLIKADKGITRASLLLLRDIKESIAGRKSEPKSVDTGRFLNSITFRKLAPLQAKVFSNAEYASILEYGTSPHYIAPKRKKALHWDDLFSKGHDVKGIKPRRHFRNSVIRITPKVTETIALEMKSI